jgi:cytochrome c551
MVFIACSNKKGERQERLKTQQYMIQGKILYMQHCSACHQEDGTGLAQLFPPLNKSDYMENNLDEVVCLIRYGKREPLTVNDIVYTQPMPGIPSLTNLEIAEILTYIYNTGEHERGLIGVKAVDSLMAKCR